MLRSVVDFGRPVVDVRDVVPDRAPQRQAPAASETSDRAPARAGGSLAASLTLGAGVALTPWITSFAGAFEGLTAGAAQLLMAGVSPAEWMVHLGVGSLVTLGGVVSQRRARAIHKHAKRVEAERDQLREYEVRALMVRGAAHDLKNLCVPLVVASDLLAESDDGSGTEELGAFIQTAADHASALLDRLVRADVDGHHTPALCMGGAELRRLEPLLDRSLKRRGHVFSCDIDDDTQVRIDRLDLAQAVVNLVTNAGFVREAPVHVQVRSFCRDGRWCVEVADDAGGIPASIADRLFEEGTTARRGGTGLGLALTRHLVERNGGTITVESDDHGTRFELSFPAKQPGALA